MRQQREVDRRDPALGRRHEKRALVRGRRRDDVDEGDEAVAGRAGALVEGAGIRPQQQERDHQQQVGADDRGHDQDGDLPGDAPRQQPAKARRADPGPEARPLSRSARPAVTAGVNR